ncbi:deoxyribonuclease I-like 3 S homeolog isoform X2 [Xenopus laevis]|uniref:Deoxyribonuclease n=1 Tax=Xenopus laevis TaxID=8355 RepID=A0A8J1MYY0_XENLA|nr:deoxyribonuclease I-like 3 S homeolog isoform X2 [Xenopus laevis]
MWRLLLLCALFVPHSLGLRICSFNVQSFGESKRDKPAVMNVVRKIISRCDITLLMEIKDSSNTVIRLLMAQLNRKNLVSVKGTYQYKDLQPGDEDAFSREPYVVWFQAPSTEVKEFVIVPQHTTPEAAVREIDELYDVYLDVKQKWNSENFIFMGDLNAGCSYVPKKSWKNIRLRNHTEFVWLIGDNNDTTVKSSTNCAYDRIVVVGEKLVSSIVPGSANVFDFMVAYGLTEEQALEVSDHFPIEVRLKESKRPTSRRRKYLKRK